MSKVCLIFEGELYEDEYSFDAPNGKHYEGVSYGIQLSDDRGFKYGRFGKHKMSETAYNVIKEYLSENKEGYAVIGADRFGNLEVKRIDKTPCLKYDDKFIN